MSDFVSPDNHRATTRRTPAPTAAILLLDETGRITAANAATCSLWQAAEMELIGKHFAHLLFSEMTSQSDEALDAEWEMMLRAGIDRIVTLKAQPRIGSPREVQVRLERALGSASGFFATISSAVEQPVEAGEQLSAFRALADNGAVGFFDLQLRDDQVYYSPTWKKILGYADDELPNTYDSWLQLIHPEDSSAAPDQIGKKKVVGPRPFDLEFRMKHRDGHYVWLQSIGLQFVDDDGSLARVVGTHLDISERKEVEESGLMSEDRLQALSSEAGPLAAFEIDFATNNAWFSEGWKRLLGYAPEDLTGPDSLFAMLPPEDGAVDLADFFINRSLGQSEFVGASHLCNKAGQFVPVIVGAHCKFTRKRELTRVVGFCCMLQPERGGLPIAETGPLPEPLLNATFAALAESVILTNGHGEILYLNAAASRLLAVASRAAVGRPLHDIFRLVRLIDGQRETDLIQGVLHGGRPLALMDGHALLAEESNLDDALSAPVQPSLRPIIWTARSAIDASGQSLGAVVVFRDPREMSLTPDELVKTSRFESLGFIANGLAQDFNNHLTTILGAVSLSRENQDFSKLADVEKACLTAKELTRQLITLAKGGTGTRSLVTPKEILDDAVTLASAGSGVDIAIRVAPDVDSITVERTPILQVFQNLIINALQSMPPSPHVARMELHASNVTLASEQVPPLSAGSYVAFEVRDNGSGIPHEHLERIWERFFTTRKHGTGLGLPTALSIVHKHGGQIGVDSTPGEGTVFTVFLPAADRPIETTATQLRAPRFRTGRILLIEDDPKLSELTGSMLQSLDYKFDVAKTGEDAIALYKRYFGVGRAQDAVLIDSNLSGSMSGEACLHALRDVDPNVCAIVTSGFDTEATTKRYLDLGFSGHLTKPYRLSDLGKMLKTVIG